MKKVYEIAALGEPLTDWALRSILTDNKTRAIEEYKRLTADNGCFELREIEVPVTFDFQSFAKYDKEMNDMFNAAYKKGYKVIKE